MKHLKLYKSFILEKLVDDKLTDNVEVLSNNFLQQYNLKLPALKKEEIIDVIGQDSECIKIIDKLNSQQVPFYINKLSNIFNTPYFNHVDKSQFNFDLNVLLLNREGMGIKMGRVEFSDKIKPSESTGGNDNDFIIFNTEGGKDGKANFMNDVEYGWIWHELGHELYYRQNFKINSDKLTELIQAKLSDFSEDFQEKFKETQKVGCYPDGEDERVANYFQHSYLIKKGYSKEEIMKKEKNSYGNWNEDKALYFPLIYDWLISIK